MQKKNSRLRRAKKTRMHIRELNVPRLSFHRSVQHIYAQVISPNNEVIASVSTCQADIKGKIKSTKSKEAAQAVGKTIAEKAVALGIKQVAFDRSGFLYHGRVQALAEAAREAGLSF